MKTLPLFNNIVSNKEGISIVSKRRRSEQERAKGDENNLEKSKFLASWHGKQNSKDHELNGTEEEKNP